MEISTKDLAEKIEGLLLEAKIYNIDAYGWLNEDDHDPAFVGYAMWTTSPPYDFTDELNLNDPEAVPSRVATPTEERLLELGTDFMELMKAARFAIGSMLLHKSDWDVWEIRSTPLEFHEVGAQVILSMACDRLRDFLILVFLADTPRFGHELDQYRLALCTARLHGLTQDVAALDALWPTINDLRGLRNETVHEIALREAKVQREIIGEQQRRAKMKRPRRRLQSEPSNVADREAEHTRALERRLSTLRHCYEALIESGDLAFRLENDMRRLRSRKAPSA